MSINLAGFIKHISEEHLIAEGQRVLLAVSGGRDSVTLLDLMCRAGFDVGVAHCNFHLRPGDCDRDQQFVDELAEKYGVKCYVAQFDTLSYASSEKLSVEEAARNLRYGFFEEVRQKEGYDLIATAHHRDDAIETFFINLLRGTGIAGLGGIPARNGVIVRPLLPYGRDEIDAYIARHRLTYVDDYTNAQPLYMRNRIRLQLMPLLRDISPSFDAVMASNISHFADAGAIYRSTIEEIRGELVVSEGDKTVIDIIKLLTEVRRTENGEVRAENRRRGRLRTRPTTEGVSETMLFELLHPYGFNSTVAAQVAQSLDGQSGKLFFSPTHRLLKDRDKLIVTKTRAGSGDTHKRLADRQTESGKRQCSHLRLADGQEESGVSEPEIRLLKEDCVIQLRANGRAASLHCNHLRPADGNCQLSKNEALFDCDKLQFPLLLRRWREGDRFRPFGMKGTRLVSDLFSDLKLSITEKERAWILCNGDEQGTILWVVGYRAAHFAVVDSTTKNVLKMNIEN